jgi:hypothetical protein
VKPVARASPKIVPIYGIVFKNPAKIAIPTPAGTEVTSRSVEMSLGGGPFKN